MIIKSYEENKIDLDKQKMHLLYGENQGQIDDLIQNKFKVKFNEYIFTYDEQEILNNESIIFNIIKTKSFFEDRKLIIINRKKQILCLELSLEVQRTYLTKLVVYLIVL